MGWWPRLLASLRGGQYRPLYLAGGAMAALAAILIIAALLFNGLGRGNSAVALNEVTGTVEIAAIDSSTWEAADQMPATRRRAADPNRQ